MISIKGIPVTLYVRTQTGLDDFRAPVYTEAPETVENVLVAPAGSTAIVGEQQLTGHQLAYTLYVPKGDTHEWTGCRVAFFGQMFRCFAPPEEWVESLVPGAWNRRVNVEVYDGQSVQTDAG